MLFKSVLLTIFVIYLLLVLTVLLRYIKPARWSAARVVRPPERKPALEKEVLIDVVDVDKSFDHPVLVGLNLKIYQGRDTWSPGKKRHG